MVLAVLSVFRFSLCERKTKNKKKVKYRCERPHLDHRVSRGIKKIQHMSNDEMMLRDLCARIPGPNSATAAAARARLDRLTKPPSSLGALEALIVRLAAITGQVRPEFKQPAVLVAAGDHGVVTERVSAYPQSVTGQMVLNFLRGGAAINALAANAGARVIVVDAGVATDLPD